LRHLQHFSIRCICNTHVLPRVPQWSQQH
jgi:hypothetical protein